jgi:cell wall assembly regulator SMI1
MSVRASWKRITDWHDGNARRGRFPLARGAPPEQVDALERTIGARLPDDVRESYLLHNGTGWLLTYGEVMPVEGVEAMWRRYDQWQRENGYGLGADWQPDQLSGPIKSIWWNRLRIPVTDNGGGDPVMIDLDPAEGGTRGQVIKFSHEVGPVRVLAPSWAEWLRGIADGLEAGKYVYIESEDTVAPPGFYD